MKKPEKYYEYTPIKNQYNITTMVIYDEITDYEKIKMFGYVFLLYKRKDNIWRIADSIYGHVFVKGLSKPDTRDVFLNLTKENGKIYFVRLFIKLKKRKDFHFSIKREYVEK